jgi:tetratricopeptide (TPR) repeat protein
MAEGVAEARRAFESDPLSAYTTSMIGFALGCDGQTAEALEKARLGVERDPDSLLTRWVHGLVAHWHGGFEESIRAFKAAEAVSGRHAYTIAHAALVYADWGKPADARALHDEMLALSARSYVPKAILATSAIAIGDMDLAIDLAHQACDEREPYMCIVARVVPDWRRLREDPRFADVLRRLAFPPGPSGPKN